MNGKRKKLDEIAAYIDRVQFRKQFFGVSISDVYESMQELNEMYQDEMARYSALLEEEYDNREEAIARNEKKIRELAGKANSVVETRKRDQKRIRELEEKLRRVTRERSEYRSQTDILASSISDTQKCKEEILLRARTEAEQIIRNAEEAGRQIGQSNVMSITEDRARYADCLERLHVAKAKAEDNLHLIRIDLYDLCAMLTSLREELQADTRAEGEQEVHCEAEEQVRQVNAG